MNNTFLSKLRRPNLAKRILDRITSYIFFEQWILLIAQTNPDKYPSWGDFSRFIPPADRVWADPFVWMRDEKIYVFFEEQPIDTKRGRICCITLDKALNIIAKETVLERPYHLSYPFIFEHDGELYMLPETGENNAIEVYLCTHFPAQWEFKKNLMSGVNAYDATIFETNGKWWLFSNIAEHGGSTWDTLHLYYADHPLSEIWVPHPLNPIIQDISSARPAGRVFLFEGKIIRPSQNSLRRYGYSINFNHVVTLTEFEYQESCSWTFEPPRFTKTIGTHTWNQTNGVLAIDAKILRPKFQLGFLDKNLS